MENKVMANWCALPEELLAQIFSRVYAADQLRSRAVCKKWFAVVPYMRKISNSLPWFINIRYLGNINPVYECHYFDLPLSSHINPFFIYKIELKPFSTLPQSHVTCVCITCKYGWLFFSIRRNCFSHIDFLLFCPLTKEIIKLPSLVHSKIRLSGRIMKAFSMEPNSRDCVFLVFYKDRSNCVIISTIRRGDKEWTSREFDDETSIYDNFAGTPVYIGGIFYFVSIYGDVASYNIVSEEWKFERFAIETKYKEYANHAQICTTELNGELVLIYFYKNTGCIRMLDWCKKVWVPLSTLCDQALFISGRGNSFSVSTFGKETSDNGISANKIYWLGDSGCTVYSLENGDLVNFRNYSGIIDWDKNYKNSTHLTSWLEPPSYLVNREPETAEGNQIRRPELVLTDDDNESCSSVNLG